MERSFVARNLRKCISYEDIIKNPVLDIEEKRQDLAKSAAVQVDNPDVFVNLLRNLWKTAALRNSHFKIGS